MRSIVFRVIGLILGLSILYVAFTTENANDISTGPTVRNLFAGTLLLIYGLGGYKILSYIPIFRKYSEQDNKNET